MKLTPTSGDLSKWGIGMIEAKLVKIIGNLILDNPYLSAAFFLSIGASGSQLRREQLEVSCLQPALPIPVILIDQAYLIFILYYTRYALK